MLSPYPFAENSPIKFIDLDGGEKKDPDPYYLKSIPAIKTTYADVVKGLSMLAVAASQNSNVEYAFGYVNTFKNAGRPLSTRNLLRYGDRGDEELVDLSKMNSLQSLGAKNFYIKAYYIQGVSGSNGS